MGLKANRKLTTGSKDKVANAASVSVTSEPKLHAVEAWVDEHADCLFRYALPRLRDRHVAEEVWPQPV